MALPVLPAIEDCVEVALATLAEIYDLRVDDVVDNVGYYVELVAAVEAGCRENPPGTVILLPSANPTVQYLLVVPGER